MCRYPCGLHEKIAYVTSLTPFRLALDFAIPRVYYQLRLEGVDLVAVCLRSNQESRGQWHRDGLDGVVFLQVPSHHGTVAEALR
jgi:hypothetical protein